MWKLILMWRRKLYFVSLPDTFSIIKLCRYDYILTISEKMPDFQYNYKEVSYEH